MYLHDDKHHRRKLPSQHKQCWLKSLAAFQTHCTRLDPAISNVKGSVNAQRVLYSHCVWPSSGLVNADERRESQDQVPAGQQDFSASFTSIRSGVGCCKQQSRDTCWLADSLSLLAASHSLSQAVPPPFSYERSSCCLPSHSQIKTHDELGCPKESFNKMPCFKTTLGT